MKKKLLILLLILIACSNPVCAQVDTVSHVEALAISKALEGRLIDPPLPSPPVFSSISVGLGQAQVRNTYLTPLLYSGSAISVGYDRMRQWKRFSQWGSSQFLDGRFAMGDDRGEHSSNWSGRLRYRYAAHYQWQLSQAFTLMAGSYLGAETGFDYNLKMGSSNNPATARVTINSGLSLMGMYRYTLWHRRSLASLQLQAPLLGYALMPEYGSSYYETFYLGSTDNLHHFTSLHNQQDFDLRLTTDIPLFRHRGGALRLGVAYHIETMDINETINRFSSFEAVVGWTFERFVPRSIDLFNVR